MDNQSITAEDDNLGSSATIYPNVSLSLESVSTRLLALYRDDMGIIYGHLESFEISDCPPFIALSYEWGPDSPTHNILLHGKSYPIRENLLNAIHAILEYREKLGKNSNHPEDYLTDGNGTILQYIWIDFICIDQENVAERNHQVNLMKSIYSQATLVVAWLGMGSEGIASIMQDFRKFRDSSAFDFSGVFKSRHRLLASFFDLEYFHRVWIVQEVVLSRQLVVMYGQEAISGLAIHKYLNHISLDRARQLSYTAGGSVFTARELTRDLNFLIRRFSHKKCTDARDRVYSLLGIANAECSTYFPGNWATYVLPSFILKPPLPGFFSKHDITADYQMSPFELYLRLVRKNGEFGLARLWHEEFLGPLNRMALNMLFDLIIPLDTSNYSTEELRSLQTKPGVHWKPHIGHRALRSLANLFIPVPFADPLATGMLYHSLSYKGKIASKEYLAYVRSLDWTKVGSWTANYNAMHYYSKSCSSSFLVRLSDLERSPMRLVEWATATLGEEPDERLKDAIARMAGKTTPWRRWGRGVVSVGEIAVRLGVPSRCEQKKQKQSDIITAARDP